MFYTTQVVGLIIAIYVLVIWLLNRKLDSFTDNIFLFASISAILSITLDIFCQVTAANVFPLSKTTIDLVLDAYLISIPLTLIGMALYINKSIFNDEIYNKIRLIITVIFVFNSLLTCLMKAKYDYSNKAIALPVGSAVTFTYIVTGLLCVILLVELIYFRKRFNEAKLLANIIWTSGFMVGGLVQFILIGTLGIPIVSLFIGSAILVLYAEIENPGNRFDYQIGSFHYETFVEYIKEVIDNEEMQSILYLSVVEKNTNNLYYVKSMFDNIVMKFEDDYSIKIFSGYTNELIITAKDFANIQNVASLIGKCVNEEVGKHKKDISYNAAVVLIPEITYINSYETIRSLFDAYKVQNNPNIKGVEVFTITKSITDKYAKEIEISRIIDYSLKNDNISIYFQPLHNRENNNIINAEAIVKIISSDGKELSPSDYYIAADKYNKFNDIDELAFKHICKTISKIKKLSNNLGYILVRISVQELERENAALEFIKIIKEEGVDADNICFELTNANSISQKEILLGNIKELQEVGFYFAIGGFGSGESNLNYFIDLPLQIVKFDLSVLTNAMKDKNAAFIMKDVTELAHSLDYKVISVGIDTEEEKKFTEECGVEMMLGSLFSSILNEDQFIQHIKEGGNI